MCFIQDYNIKKFQNTNFNSIPKEFLNNSQLCLWKYEQKDNYKLKVPYGVNQKGEVQRNLKNKNFWINLQDLKSLSEEDKSRFGLGIVLYNNNYTCIDIDNCLIRINDKYRVSSSVYRILRWFVHTYCEISPSNKGLHIFFKGLWNHSIKKICNPQYNFNIEIYSVDDWRFITLTGNQVIYQNDKSFNISNSFNACSSYLNIYDSHHPSLKFLYRLFDNFSKSKFNTFNKKNKNIDLGIDQCNLIDNIIFSIGKNKVAQKNYETLSVGKKIKSSSEDDFIFCLFILNYVNPILSNEIIKGILIHFLQKERFRDKINCRFDYLLRTASKAIVYSRDNKLIGNKLTLTNTETGGKFVINYAIKNLIKICNQMNIFFISNRIKQQKFLFDNKDNNKVEFFIPDPLNCYDLDYFIEILYQFSQKRFSNNLGQKPEISQLFENYANKDIFFINLDLALITKRLNKKDSGPFRNSLMNCVKKLSMITMIYSKQINLDGPQRLIEGSTKLLDYQVIKLKDTQSYEKVQVQIFLNSLTFSILKNSSYNYTIINTAHRNILPNSELRFLYNYICLKTTPGNKFTTNIAFEVMLKELWSQTNVQSTIRCRKIKLIRLLEDFYRYIQDFNDFDIKYVFLEQTNKNKFHHMVMQVKRKRIIIK